MGTKKIKFSVHSFYISNLNRYTIAGSLVILSCIYLYSNRTPHLNIFPIKPTFSVGFVNDSAMGGHSKILTCSVSDSSICIDFKLGKSMYEPYVGFNIQSDNGEFINLKPYNTVEFEAEGEGINNILFYLIVQNTDTALNLVSQEIYLTYNLEITSKRMRYSIPLSQLTPPDWWYATNKLVPNKTVYTNLAKVRLLNFANGPTLNTDKKLSLKVHSLSFSRNNHTLLWILVLIELVLIFLLIAWHRYIFNIQHKPAKVIITYKPVALESPDQRFELFIEYINSHFHDADLTLEQVAEITGISQRRIANHILKTFACNFKTYVNQLRINESKRLIKESALNMSEIAYKVGFNSPNHFNRVFKIIEGINPTELKELK